MSDMINIYTVVTGIVSAVTSAKAWEYWITKVRTKNERYLSRKEDSIALRENLSQRIDDLTKELRGAYKKIELLNEKVTELSVNLAKTEASVEILQKGVFSLEEENKSLKLNTQH